MKKSSAARILYPATTFMVILVLWEVTIKALHIPKYFIPAPSDVGLALVQGSALYAVHFLITMYATLASFAIAFTLALVLGTLIAEVLFLERTIFPVLVGLQSMPRIALAPIIIVWFGFGVASKIVLGVISAFFPMFLNMVHGLSTVDAEQIALMRTWRANRWQIFWQVKFPNALPFLLAGMNVGIIFAMLAVIVAEFLGSNAGMGFLIVNQSNMMDTAGVFANIIILSIAGIVFHYGIQYARRRLLFWSAGSEVAGTSN